MQQGLVGQNDTLRQIREFLVSVNKFSELLNAFGGLTMFATSYYVEDSYVSSGTFRSFLSWAAGLPQAISK